MSGSDSRSDVVSRPPIVIGIDASRNRSGGAKGHLVGILTSTDPREHGIAEVHVWSYDSLLDALPDAEWLIKHRPPALGRSLYHQLWWQRRVLPKEASASNLQILLNTDAGTVCRFAPSVTMSRDMLSYEPGQMRHYRFSKMWLRLLALRYVQGWSLTRSAGAIFLTRYAADVIQRVIGPVRRQAVIPHGISPLFRREPGSHHWPIASEAVRCLYVSQVDFYKHQWVVVQAVAELRRRGRNLRLLLAGGGAGKPQQRLEAELASSDPERAFVDLLGVIDPAALPQLLADSHVFVFASSCENMPNTLLEGMASGLPIACSNRGPMPEVLRDGGVYFDPEKVASIVNALEQILDSAEMRQALAHRGRQLADTYSWDLCASHTWRFLREIYYAQH